MSHQSLGRELHRGRAMKFPSRSMKRNNNNSPTSHKDNVRLHWFLCARHSEILARHYYEMVGHLNWKMSPPAAQNPLAPCWVIGSLLMQGKLRAKRKCSRASTKVQNSVHLIESKILVLGQQPQEFTGGGFCIFRRQGPKVLVSLYKHASLQAFETLKLKESETECSEELETRENSPSPLQDFIYGRTGSSHTGKITNFS